MRVATIGRGVDSRFRRNDGRGGNGRGWRRKANGVCHPLTVIPAQAGIQNPGGFGVSVGRGVDSRFRGDDGYGGRGGARLTAYAIPPLSFRRRPESRTPVVLAYR